MDNSSLPPEEDRLRQLAEAVDGVFWSVSPDETQVFYLSPGFEAVTGLSPHAFLQTPSSWLETVHPEDQISVRTAFAGDGRTASGCESHVRFRAIRPDGSVRDAFGLFWPILNPDGEIVSRCGLVFDLTRQTRNEEALQLIVAGTSTALTGTEFFAQLTRSLAHALGVRYTFVGEAISPDEPTRVRTMVICDGGKIVDNIEYDLVGTPCEGVVGGEPALYASKVRQRFPNDPILVEMNVESYFGVPLIDTEGQLLGLLVAMHDEPMPDSDLARSVLSIFAARAASELKRLRAEEVLRQSETRFQTLLDTIDHIVWTATRDGSRILYINRAAERVYGRPATEFYENSTLWLDVVYPRDRAIVEQSAQDLIDHGRVETEYRIERPDGEIRWLLDRKFLVCDKTGEPVRMTGTALDITERKHALQRLGQLEREKRLILDSSSESIVYQDRNQRILWANRAAAQSVDTKPEELVGRFCYEVWHQRTQTCDGCPVRRALETGMPHEGEITSPDGRAWWIRGFPVHDEEGQITGATEVTLEITEQKCAESALRENWALLEATLESTADGILVVDDAGKVIHTNRHFADLWQIPDALLRTRDDDKLLAFVLDQLVDPEAFLTKVRELYGSTREDLDTLHFKDGRIFERYSRPLLRNGDIAGRVWSFRDVTERVRHQMELARAKRLETAGQLAGQIAHDFNNLLGPLAAYPEMARRHLHRDSPVHRMLDIIETCAAQMADINQQLLTLSRRGHYRVEPLDLNRIIEETLQTASMPTTVVVNLQLDADLFPCKGGKAQIQRVLVNLLNNAREAVDGVGQVNIGTDNIYLDRPLTRYSRIKKGEYVRIRMTDNGSGIPPEVMDRIFDPFFTTKTTDKHRGTGLGLSVVHSVVEDHDGYVDIESTPGRGTTISLYFPICRANISLEETPSEMPRGMGQRVLVVDDDPIQRQMAKDALTELGYDVCTAASGEEALKMAERATYDILVLDMVMDGIDGVETLGRIQIIHPGQAAVLLSGYAANDRVEEAMELGVRDFLAKPVRIPTLAVAIHRALLATAPVENLPAGEPV